MPFILKKQIITDERGFLNLKTEWNSIVDSYDYSIFNTFEWSYNYWKNIHRSKKLFIIVLLYNREIVCIAPFVQKKIFFIKRYTFISDLDSDKNDILVKPGFEKNSLDCIMDIIGNNLFVLNNIPENSAIHSYANSEKVELKEFIKKQNVSPYITINEKWDKYLNTVSKKLFQDSQRQKRRLKKFGEIYFDYANQKNQIVAMINKLDEFKGKRSYSNMIAKNYFDRPGIKNFLIEICKSFREKGYLSLTSFYSTNQVYAVHLGFVYKQCYYYYLPSFNPEFYSFSVGRLLMENSIKEAFELKLKKYDFLNGDEKYKYKYSDKQINIYQFSNYQSKLYGKVIRYFEEIIIPFLSKITFLRGIRKMFLAIINRIIEKI